MIELAPAFGLDPKVREALHADAVKIAKHVGCDGSLIGSVSPSLRSNTA